MKTLTIHPSQMALRQWQKRELGKTGFVDCRNQVSLSGFFGDCTEAARRAGLISTADGRFLRPIDDLEQELAVVEAALRFRMDAARKNPVLGRLPEKAIEQILSELLNFMDPLANRAGEMLEILRGFKGPAAGKNKELARLYETYDAVCVEGGLATNARVNAAILAVLGDRDRWPACLRDVDEVRFVGLRWVQPFVELVARELVKTLGAGKVVLAHVLQEHEHEFWGRDLASSSGKILFSGEDEVPLESGYSPDTVQWLSKLIDLREGLAVKDENLAESARDKVGFSQSVGTYGEVEDLARRVAWHIHNGMRPDEICLTMRDLGKYTDPIVDVFERFGIPHYFRRGIPVLSIPLTKTVMALVRFSAESERDVLCALLQSPWLDWTRLLPDTEKNGNLRAELADDIRRAGVEKKATDEAVQARLDAYYGKNDTGQAKAVRQAFRAAHGRVEVRSLREAVKDLKERIVGFDVRGRLEAFADASAGNPAASRAYVLNARAYAAIERMLDRLEEMEAHAKDKNITWTEFEDVLSRALNNITVSDPQSNDSGVWIVSPFDVAGLKFRMVIVAGLNTGGFPIIPAQSAVFHNDELAEIKKKLGPELPVSALASSQARASQENLLFLSLIAAASERLVLSRTSKDENGTDVAPSIFFGTIWRLAGWPALKELPEHPPEDYDRWRLETAPAVFGAQWASQRGAEAHRRAPFQGESYLGTIPEELCCSEDEARQWLTAGGAGRAKKKPGRKCHKAAGNVAENISYAMRMETERQKFFDEMNAREDGTMPAVDGWQGRYVGQIDSNLWARLRPASEHGIPDVSPSELVTIATCPYQYYLQRVLGLEQVETNDLEASPRDHGTLIHMIMSGGFKILLGEDKIEGIERAEVAALRAESSGAAKRAMAVRKDGGWFLSDDSGRSKEESIPLIILDGGEEKLLWFFDKLCHVFETASRSGRQTWKLGAPEQLDVEWKRIRNAIRTLAGLQFNEEFRKNFGTKGEAIRAVALIEHVFNSHSKGYSDSIELVDDKNGKKLKIHGRIDRVDMVFDAGDGNRLRAVAVVDYKGSSGKDKAANIAENIIAGLDCQAPAYSIAAAECLGVRGDPGVRVVFNYVSYKGDEEDLAKSIRDNRIEIGRKLTEEEGAQEEGTIEDAWKRRMFECLRIIESGAFFVRPADCGYCPFAGICRYSESALHSEEEGGA